MTDARNSITLASGRRYSGPLYGIGDVEPSSTPLRTRTHDAAWETVDELEDEPRRSRGTQEHVHIYLPVGWAPQPAQPAPHRTQDAAMARGR
jgi:hypothetical protein